MAIDKITSQPSAGIIIDKINGIIDELQNIPSEGFRTITADTTFTVPSGIYNLKVSGCAAGLNQYAGEYVMDLLINVTPGQQIPITVGEGNTVVGGFLTLAAGSYAGAFPNTKLGYATGYNGGDISSYISYGYGGAFGYGGGGAICYGGNGAAGGGGMGGDGASVAAGAVGNGGGTSGGNGCNTMNSQWNSDGSVTLTPASDNNAKVGDLVSPVITFDAKYAGYNGHWYVVGRGSVYGAGGGFANNGEPYGGSAGGYGAGGGCHKQTASSTPERYGAPSNGIVIIEWGTSL